MLLTRLSRLGLGTRILPIIGLMAAVATTAPAMAQGGAGGGGGGGAAGAAGVTPSQVFTSSSAGALSVKQTVVTAAIAGQPSAIIIEITNTTTGAATDVFAGAQLPVGARLGALPNPNLCGKTANAGSPAFGCYVGTLAPGAVHRLTVQAVLTQAGVDRVAASGIIGGVFSTTVNDLAVI